MADRRLCSERREAFGIGKGAFVRTRNAHAFRYEIQSFVSFRAFRGKKFRGLNQPPATSLPGVGSAKSGASRLHLKLDPLGFTQSCHNSF